MILNFLDPALERIWRKLTYPYLPGHPDGLLIRIRLCELYQVLDRLDAAGLNGMKGREVEKSGSVYYVTIRCGFVRFRIAGRRDVADVGFESAVMSSDGQLVRCEADPHPDTTPAVRTLEAF